MLRLCARCLGYTDKEGIVLALELFYLLCWKEKNTDAYFLI